MSMLKTIFRTEYLLLFRNKFVAIPLIVNLLCWGFIVISYEIQDVHFEERAAAFYSGFLWMLLLNLLIVGLLAVYMAGKDRESGFEYLVVTYQVKNAEWIMGKWLVVQLYGLCITFIAVLVQFGWFLSSKMTFAELVKNVFYVFIQMEGALFFVISLGFLFGIILKNMFAYILIPVILVLSLGLPFDYTGVAYTYDNPRFHLLTPFNYMYIESPYEGIWGIDRVFESTILHQFIVLLLGIVFILVTLLLFRSNRKLQREKKIIPMMIVILMIPILLLSGIRYAQYDQALEQFITTGKEYVERWDDERFYYSHLDHKKYDFSMERTDLAVQLKPNNQIDVTSNLTIKHIGDASAEEVYLTLFHGLEVTECASESKITCSRKMDFITVHFDEMIEPGEEFNLKLNYKGSVLQYRDEGYVEQSFIDNNRVYLPKEAGWYPLIGERKLVVAYEHNMRYVQFEQRNGRLVEDYPTEFTVEVLNETGEIPLALTIPETEAGMYQGTSQYGLSLVGGNLKEMMVGQIRVVGHPEVLSGAKEAIQAYQKTWHFIEEWLEIPMMPEAIYILNDWHSYLTSNTPSQEILVWGTDFLGDTRESTIAYLAVNYLISDNLSWDRSADLHLLNSLVEWSILSTFQDEESFKKWYRPMETPMKETGLVETLDEYEKQGKLSEAIKFMYHQYAELEDKNEFDLEAALQLYEGDPSL